MAKTGLINISANNTFQVWLDRTNELVNLIGTDVLTASASPGDTTGSVSSPKVATLIGTFAANTITAETRLRTDKIETTSTDVTIEAPTIISSSQRVGIESFSNSANPVLRLNNDSVSWDVGFLNSQDFTINNGSAAERLKLTPAGDLTIAGSITNSGGGTVTADVTGNVTGNLTGNVTGNLTGNVTGNVTGDLTGNVTIESGGTLDFSDATTVQVPSTFGVVPQGGIIMWSGSIEDIPSGWALCDGDNDTPNLQNRFIVGAGDSYGVANTGGADSVTLTLAQMPTHTHDAGNLETSSAGAHTHTYSDSYLLGGGSFVDSADGGSDKQQSTQTLTTNSAGAHTHEVTGYTASIGGGQSHENRPPYYALAYIMKL